MTNTDIFINSQTFTDAQYGPYVFLRGGVFIGVLGVQYFVLVWAASLWGYSLEFLGCPAVREVLVLLEVPKPGADKHKLRDGCVSSNITIQPQPTPPPRPSPFVSLPLHL